MSLVDEEIFALQDKGLLSPVPGEFISPIFTCMALRDLSLT